jgi:hypothetical protein
MQTADRLGDPDVTHRADPGEHDNAGMALEPGSGSFQGQSAGATWAGPSVAEPSAIDPTQRGGRPHIVMTILPPKAPLR